MKRFLVSEPGTKLWLRTILVAIALAATLSSTAAAAQSMRFATALPSSGRAMLPTGPAVTVAVANANIRSGPGLGYPVIGHATRKTQFAITGKTAAGDWWQVDYRGKPAWIAASVITAANAGKAPVITQIPPLPKSAGAAKPVVGAGHIAFTSGREGGSDVAVLDVATGKVALIAQNGRQPDIRWDGHVVFNGEGGGQDPIFTTRPDGSFLTQLTRHPEDSYVQWAPGKPAILFQSTSEGPDPRVYIQWDTTAADSVMSVRVEYGGVDTGTPVPIFGRSPTWLDNGRIAYSGCDAWAGAGKCGIWSIDAGTYSNFRPWKLSDDTQGRPSDAFGSTLLYSSPEGGNWDIWAVDTGLPKSNATPPPTPRRLTIDPAQDVGATFSPDGKRIAFISNRGGTWGIWVMESDGRNPRLLSAVPQGFGAHWDEERLSWGP